MKNIIEYKIIPNFSNYKVGTDGTVWSKSTNSRNSNELDGWHLLKGGLDKDGYKKLILCANGKRKHVRVNILILTIFIGPPPEWMIWPTASHNNGIKTDNRLENLSWKTQKDNIKDKIQHGTAQIGEKHGCSKLSEKIVKDMRKMYKEQNLTLKNISKIFNQKYCTVCAAISGRNWKHLKDEE